MISRARLTGVFSKSLTRITTKPLGLIAIKTMIYLELQAFMKAVGVVCVS
jgi:hypothetical protein